MESVSHIAETEFQIRFCIFFKGNGIWNPFPTKLKWNSKSVSFFSIEMEYVFRLVFFLVFLKLVLACFKLVGEVERVLK